MDNPREPESTTTNSNTVCESGETLTVSKISRTSLSEMKWIPDVVNVEIPVNEKQYMLNNGLNFHVKMSDRKLAVFRQRTQRLRQRDAAIRERSENLRRKAKTVVYDSPAKLDVISRHDENTSDVKIETKICEHQRKIVSHENRIEKDTPDLRENIDPASQSKSGSRHNVHNTENGTGNTTCVTSQHETVESGECNIVPTDNQSNKTGNDDCGNLSNSRQLCDDDPASKNNVFSESKLEAELRPTDLSGSSTVDLEIPGCENIGKPETDRRVRKDHVESPAVKLKSFVGERYSSNIAILSKSHKCCSSKGNILTPKRNTCTVEKASPKSLGVSPARIDVCKSAKKSRKLSMLTSPFTPKMKLSKLKIKKKIFNVLRTDNHTNQVF